MTSRAPAVRARSAISSLSTSESALEDVGTRATSSSPPASVTSAASYRPDVPVVSWRTPSISTSGRAAEAAAARVRSERAMPPRLGGKHVSTRHATQRSAQETATERTLMIDLVDAFDTSAHERTSEDLVERLRQDPATRVLQVASDSAPIVDGAVDFAAPDEVADGASWAFLGRGKAGEAILLAVF